MADKKVVFIAFAIEDEKQRDLLKGQSLNTKSPFEYIDMSVKQPYDKEWKERVRTRIKRSDGVIVLVSKNSLKSSGQKWEIECAREEKKKIRGIWAYSSDRTDLEGVYTRVWSCSGGGGKSALQSQMAIADFKADSTAEVLELLVDGGETQELVDDVDQSTPPESVVIYDELMSESPYLSDSVVESAIIKEDVLPNAMIRDIMVANTHSSKSDELIDLLNTRWDPMPDYMKAQILQGRSLVSLKEETESRLGAYKQSKLKAFNGLVNYYITDTIAPSISTDSLIDLLTNSDLSSSHYKLALLHFNKDDDTLGSNVLANIPVVFDLSTEETLEHQNMVNYYNLLSAINQQGNLFNPDSTQQLQLQSIQNNDSTRAGVFARNLLLNIDVTDYNEPIILPDLYKTRLSIANYNILINSKAPTMIKIYPNPAQGYVIIEYGVEAISNSKIIIRNLSGNIITNISMNNLVDQEVVNTKNWTPGIYIATLEVNGKPFDSVKFTVLD